MSIFAHFKRQLLAVRQLFFMVFVSFALVGCAGMLGLNLDTPKKKLAAADLAYAQTLSVATELVREGIIPQKAILDIERVRIVTKIALDEARAYINADDPGWEFYLTRAVDTVKRFKNAISSYSPEPAPPDRSGTTAFSSVVGFGPSLKLSGRRT